MPGKLDELLSEFRTVLGGRLLDVILPPLIFLLVNATFGVEAAIYTALGLSILFSIWRLARGQALTQSLLGVVSVLLAFGLVSLLGRLEGFFLPGLLSSWITTLLCLLSLLIRRPLTAWSSFLARRWPLGWYWHPRIRPAYSETTLLWTLFFGLKTGWQTALFQGGQAQDLGWVQTLTGWPALIVLLAITYLYGTWRQRQLGGPSVDEFKNNAPPPWQGQRRGF